MFLLLSLLVLSTDVLGYHLADLTLPSNPHNELEITYEKCLSMRKILYEDQCWDLLSKGPCNEGKWHYSFHDYIQNTKHGVYYTDYVYPFIIYMCTFIIHNIMYLL